MASSAWSIGAGKFAESGVGMVTFGTVAGGAGAALTGGNFWQGAATGLVVSGLNHFAHQMSENDSYNGTGKNLPTPDASELDPRYKTDGKDWQKVKGRWTITTKKEILQWDSKKGEIEVYNKGTKQHLGGFDPSNRSRQISKPVSSRIPNGGWKINTSKVLSFSTKVINFIDKVDGFLNRTIFMPLPPLFEMQMQMIPGYESPNQKILYL